MATGNKVLIFRWFEEVWNRQRGEMIPEVLHPDVIIYGLNPASLVPLRGPDAFRAFWEAFIKAVPDIHVAVESTVAEDDKVVARCNVRGRHTGPGLGVEATGAVLSFNGICLCQVKDGLILESWNSFDFLTFYRQIGLITFPETGAAVG